jgi:Xaa-Pro aminopeptidase
MFTHIDRDVWNYGVKSKLFKGVQTLGFESDRMGYTDAVEIRNVIRPIKFKPAPCEIEPFTRPKDPVELDFMRQSAALAEKTFEKMLGIIKPGMSELDVAIELIYQARKLGSEGEPFEPIVGSGERSALVHSHPSTKKIKKNELLLLDFGCKVNGFCSDITRVICVGKPTKEQKQIYKIVYEAQQNAIKNARPGINGQILDKHARSIIEKAGFGENFKHSLGHGIGIAPHESPLITFRLEDQIVPEDAVISIEPGIYFKDKFGIRIEDNIHVTRNGAVNLTNAPDDIVSI